MQTTETKNEIVIENFGPKNPILTFITGVHGDEQASICGANLLKEYIKNRKLKRGFRIIYANKKAIAKRKRFIKSDLNRAFPGDANSADEEKIAADLLSEIRKTDYNFDFHSSPVEISPYGIISVYNPKVEKAMHKAGVYNYLFDNSESLIKFARNGIAFEVGKEGCELSSKSAYSIMKTILARFGVIEEQKSKLKKECRIFLIYHFIKKNGLTAISDSIKDFKLVKSGTALGKTKDGRKLIAGENFYPVLTNAPELILKAKRIDIRK